MDDSVRDEEAGTPPTTAAGGSQRRRSSVPSFLFISFILFMLTNHNSDEFLARHQYQDALKTLTYQLSNYTAWLNGTESNFTLPDQDPSLGPLLESFQVFNSFLDPNVGSYYSNITGFIHGDTKYHNITPTYIPSNLTDVVWEPPAINLMAGTNMTDMVAKIGSWNWSACDKVALSVVEKTTSQTRGDIILAEKIALIHGRIELTDANTAEDLRLEFEGVHFVQNGSIYGLAEPTGRHIDIRHLPSLVPDQHRNGTASVISPELTARISKLSNLIDAGIIDQEAQHSDETSKSTCPFMLYAQIESAAVPEVLMQEIEDELQKPTGIWTVKPPKLSVGGLLISKECGIAYELVNTEGLRSRTFFRKVTTYAGTAAAIYLILLILLSRQMERSRTPAGISRVSRWSFLTQAIVDSLSFAGHVTFAILAEGRPSLSLIAPAFLACILFVYEAQFALLIHQVQLPEEVVPSPTPAARVTSPPAPSSPSSPAPAVPPVQPDSLPTPTVQTSPRLAPPSFWSLFVRHIRSDPQARLWLTLFIFLTFIVRVILSPSLALSFVAIMYSLFWMPQIVRSARRGRSSGLSMEYLVGTTMGRLYFAIYFLGCPKNVLDVEPRSWVYLLASFVVLQVIVIAIQEHFGPAFFLPRKYVIAQTYDYHPPLALPDSESPEQSLGDCAICMDAITVDPSFHRSKDVDGKEKGEKDHHKNTSGLLHVVQIGVVATARKNYSLAPCQHLFHTECLETWLAIKIVLERPDPPPPPPTTPRLRLVYIYLQIKRKIFRMSLLSADKPVEVIHPDNLPDTNPDEVSKSLETLVDLSESRSDVAQGIHARMHMIPSMPWLHPLIKGIENVATKYHVGNYVVVRGTNNKIFESMPIYARIGMHLLFYGKEQVKLLENNRTIEKILREQSIKEGQIYDSPESTKSIASFVHTYSLQLDELLYPDLSHYKTFNEFFYRQLREGARPVQNSEDPSGFCSAADCRLVVYQTVALAQQFWIKGDEFSIHKLLNVDPKSERAAAFDGSSLAIFRLAPADYHRFHSPADAVVGDVEHIPGQYYTVNPQAVNEPDFDVFTANTRSVLYLTHEQTGLPVAFIAIGALLVGSIKWTAGGEKGKSVKKGDELGYFAYGGSTVVVLFPTGVIDFDEDLVTNSKSGLETLMKVGYSLGHGPK